jgi:hypothetical protein
MAMKRGTRATRPKRGLPQWRISLGRAMAMRMAESAANDRDTVLGCLMDVLKHSGGKMKRTAPVPGAALDECDGRD